MHLLNENQYISIQICCNLFCVILNRCFVIKESNPDLVPLLSYHIKYLVMSYISQLCHMITFERGGSRISHLHQSPCYPSSSMTFINVTISIWSFQESQNNFRNQKLTLTLLETTNIYLGWLKKHILPCIFIFC